ncbi:MAG: two-component system, cell cycle sensor histidine kinase and response regulator CckA [Verrucomicrobiota bacterium]|nr:two-component system, cell cycle sensor histidine kinase and response regulator CckA [Verrucomicrobiota bacterium]
MVMLAAAGLAAVGVSAQEPPLPEKVVTTAGDFWTVSDAERQLPHRLQMEVVVYYYDPAWKLLYGQTGALSSYLPVTGKALPIKAGQKVRLEGTVIPAYGIDGSRTVTTVLAEDQLPAPVPAAGRLGDLGVLNGHLVLLEGYVLGQNEPDPTHIEARVWSEGRLVNLTVQISGTDPVPQLIGARVRIQGVYDVATDTAGGIQNIQLWTSSRQHVEVLGWLADDERFRLVRTPVERLEAAAQRPWVRVVGELRRTENGSGYTVRDETGQVALATVQPGVPQPGTTVEVVGRVAPAELGWILQEPLLRSHVADSEEARGPGRPLPVRLRLAEQVLQLEPQEAENRHPVVLRGVVTWAGENSDRFYVQDISGGVAVRRLEGPAPEFGTSVIVTGVTARGRFLPEVEARSLEQLGTQNLPSPRRISLEQAMSGAEDGRRVELRGFVRQVSPSGPWTRLDLTSATGEFTVFLPPAEALHRLPGAMVRVQGVCTSQSDPGHDDPVIKVWAQDHNDILVDEPSPADAFSQSIETVATVRQLHAAQTAARRVRLRGTVLLHEPGRYLYLQDATGGLFVLSREAGRLVPGTTVDMVGLIGRLGGRPVLREAHWRTVDGAPDVVPLGLTDLSRLRPEADARLVRLEAMLRQVVTEGRTARLLLQDGGVIFEVMLPMTDNLRLPEPGSRLEATGVYVLEFDEYRRPRSFKLEMRMPADLVLRESPSWWTIRRIAYATAALMLITLLAAGWVVALRRRVSEQTEQIRQQLEKEANLQTELERSSRLESLGVLAGGIAHDFNNLLTSILGNLGLASMDKRVMDAAGDCLAEAERGARRARDITQQLLTFAKGGDPVRTAVALPDIVTEAANFARHGSNVRFEFDLPADLPPGDVDAGQISRVVHNLVINAVQAMPDGGLVQLSLVAATLRAGEVDALPAGPYLRLTISDSGPGIPADVLPRIFDPYFSTKSQAGSSGLGLATVRSIVKKHNGHIEVESRLGQGTTFRLWLPAAGQESPATGQAGWRSIAHLPARILVMDDEDVIRRVVGRMLALAGHETVFALDGAEAVRAYVAARQSGRPFDVVIFDLTVPGGMGGREALQELLKIDPRVRAVASSGYSSDPVMGNPRAYGFRVSLPKPYDIPDLMRAVEAARQN